MAMTFRPTMSCRLVRNHDIDKRRARTIACITSTTKLKLSKLNHKLIKPAHKLSGGQRACVLQHCTCRRSVGLSAMLRDVQYRYRQSYNSESNVMSLTLPVTSYNVMTLSLYRQTSECVKETKETRVHKDPDAQEQYCSFPVFFMPGLMSTLVQHMQSQKSFQ